MNLMKLKRKIKRKMPKFLRQDTHRVKRLKNKPKWRRPKGMHSKVRRKEKQKGKMPSPGYRTPKRVRGLHPSGLIPVIVNNLEELKSIGKKKEGAIISSRVGKKKKLEMLDYANKHKFTILNVKINEKNIKKEETSKKKSKVKEKKKND